MVAKVGFVIIDMPRLAVIRKLVRFVWNVGRRSSKIWSWTKKLAIMII